MSGGPGTLLHEHSPPHIRWTTVNMAEVLPGVLTPLAWSWWRDPCEAGQRQAFADTGVLPQAHVPPPAEPADRLTGLFHGRLAGNLTFIGSLCDAMPGTSSQAFEEQIFGRADPDVPRARSLRRYPFVALSMPLHLLRLPPRLHALRAEVDTWWRAATDRRPAEPPRVRLRQAQDMLRRAMRLHMLGSLAAQGCYDRVTQLAARAGRPGLELTLTTGYGGMEETGVSADLWDVSRDRLDLDRFLRRHGYHGPNEGQLASRSWREDRRGLDSLVKRYRERDEHDGPRAREARQIAARRVAEAELLAALPRPARPGARLTLVAARRYLPLREVGKATFLQAVDAGRAAAREVGDELARANLLADREDVFFLTMSEVVAEPTADLGERAGTRKAQHAEYLGRQLPERWVGMPEPVIAGRTQDPPSDRAGAEDPAGAENRAGAANRAGAPDRGDGVVGVAVSPGVVEGRARVVHDPNEIDDFEPDDILVCETTDPSWVLLFQIAGAAVIDVGGAMSHGAIVARELGLPCVINTRTGTRTIPDHARIRVDGTTGHVDVLD